MAYDQARPPLAFVESGVGNSAPLPQVYNPAADGVYPEVVKVPTDPGHYPEVVKLPTDAGSYPEVVPTNAPPPLHENSPNEKQPRTCFGLKRRWLYVLVLAICLIIVGAVVGGVVGSRSHKSSDHHDASSPAATTTSRNSDSETIETSSTSKPTDTATATATATGTQTSGVVGPTAIAAAVSFDNQDQPSIQVFYQPESSDKITYKVYAGEYGSEKTVNIPRSRGSKTPMAVASHGDTNGNSIVNIFYIEGSGDSMKIVSVTMTCDKGKTSCSEKSPEVIAKNPSAGIHPDSKIAALWIGQSGFTLRVYFQSSDGSIVELSGDSKWASRTLAAKALDGSNIAVTVAEGPILDILYVSAAYKRPEILTYRQTSGWDDPVPINSNSIPGWVSSAPLAACYEPAVDIYRFYYTNAETHEIMEWWRYANESVFRAPGRSELWLSADSGLAALCWKDQARLLYLSNGALKESVLSKGIWLGTQDLN